MVISKDDVKVNRQKFIGAGLYRACTLIDDKLSDHIDGDCTVFEIEEDLYLSKEKGKVVFNEVVAQIIELYRAAGWVVEFNSFDIDHSTSISFK